MRGKGGEQRCVSQYAGGKSSGRGEVVSSGIGIWERAGTVWNGIENQRWVGTIWNGMGNLQVPNGMRR